MSATAARALVTGASAGLGREFAGQLAAAGTDLVLVARDRDRLEQVVADLVAAAHVRGTEPVAIEVLPADLSTDEGTSAVMARLADPARPIDLLVNNAGLGIKQRFVGGDLAREEYLLEVLVRAVLRLSHAAAAAMVSRGAGRIINVSSVATWTPTGTYSAAKAWVTVFTESLAGELAGTGVTATVVCPGFTRTEFHGRAGMSMKSVPSGAWLDAADVVREALAAAAAGKAVSVPSRRYKTLVGALHLIPRPLIRRATRGRAADPALGR
ncbi:MAG: SDR family NAD(P)-dependent oxidoreductase [Candidatus Nanopelagicales bacterium]